MSKYPLTYEEFKEIYSKVPRLCVDLVIQTEERILLVERNLESWNGMWHLPGGTVYYKESLKDAVKRVAKDEVNLEVSIEKQIGTIEYITEEKERGFGYSIAIAFLCKPIAGEAKGMEGEKIGFFKDLPENIVIEQKEFLQIYLQQ